MTPLRRIADLDVSAASGAVLDGPTLYVVADDELFLDGYAVATGARTRASLCCPAALSDEPRARSARSPISSRSRGCRAVCSWHSAPVSTPETLASGGTARGAVHRRPTTDPPKRRSRAAVCRDIRRVGAVNIEGAAVAGHGSDSCSVVAQAPTKRGRRSRSRRNLAAAPRPTNHSMAR